MKFSELEMIEIIKQYGACANYCLRLLKTIYNGPENILYAWKVKKYFDREGVVENMYYRFHGRGCYCKIDDTEIDIDFSFNGQRVDGFDFDRLYFFAVQKIGMHQTKLLESAVHCAVKEGVLIKDPDEPNGHLYYYNGKE